MSKLDQALLERYYDGELSEKDAKKVEELLASSAENESYLEGLGRVTDLMHLMHEDSVSSVNMGSLRASIVEKVEQEKASRLSERVKVWFAEFFEHRQAVWVPSAVVAGAAAVALVVATTFTGGPGVQQSHPEYNNQIWVASHKAPSAQVVNVDYKGGNFSVYDLQNEDGGKVAVVWLEEGL